MKSTSAVPARCAAAPAVSSSAVQVVLEVAVVGEAGLGLEIQTDLDVLVLDLERLGEARERAQRALAERFRLLVAGQAQQRHAQLRREQSRQRAALGRFDAQRLDAGGLGVVAHAVEQYRLADAAQPHHQEALGRQAAARSAHGDPDRLAQLVAACELGRRRARAWGKGIGDRVHRRGI